MPTPLETEGSLVQEIPNKIIGTYTGCIQCILVDCPSALFLS